jgi:hypothetical protein
MFESQIHKLKPAKMRSNRRQSPEGDSLAAESQSQAGVKVIN